MVTRLDDNPKAVVADRHAGSFPGRWVKPFEQGIGNIVVIATYK
jgi:hypothetical protein